MKLSETGFTDYHDVLMRTKRGGDMLLQFLRPRERVLRNLSKDGFYVWADLNDETIPLADCIRYLERCGDYEFVRTLNLS